MLSHYTGFQDLNKVKIVSFQIERTRENAGFEVARIKTVCKYIVVKGGRSDGV